MTLCNVIVLPEGRRSVKQILCCQQISGLEDLQEVIITFFGIQISKVSAYASGSDLSRDREGAVVANNLGNVY